MGRQTSLTLDQRVEAERLCGPQAKPPFLVTDNGSSFIAKRFVEFTREDLPPGANPLSHADAVGPAGAI